MTDTRSRMEPGPDHPITIHPNPGHVTVRSESVVIAVIDRALDLREAIYPPVLYIPLADVDQNLLRANDEHTYCPYKGEASYHNVLSGDGALAGAVWYYPDPYDAVESIRDHVAFYADRVTITNEP